MTQAAVDALRAEREEVLKLGRSLTPEEWEAPSDCEGWRVQDVIAHMTLAMYAVVDQSKLPQTDNADIERDMDVAVETRKDWTPEQVLADYESLSAEAIENMANLQAEPLASTLVPMKNLGSHPLHLVPNAFVFDHYTHLRVDILQPTGPIDRPPLPSDELRLEPTIDWMLAGLPQMCADALAKVATPPVRLELTGPGAKSITIGGDDGDTPAATIRSSARDFVTWGTQRRPWREFDVTIEGDADLAAAVADNINII